MTPSFIGRDISLYPNIVSSDMASGFWTSSPSGLDKTASPTTYIGSTTVLNTVKYAYTFAIEHQFTVSDYPFFVIDFNNELLNFNSSTRFIDGAEIAVDIYFVGKDEPYTVTGDWAGYTISADGTTPNRMFVDLLALDPTLADETVYAFAIRPYSNIYLTPQNYNTSASADRYIYFRLLNAGFYSTVQNVSAITSQTHSKVNDFEKIALENVPKYLNVGDTLLPSDITVKAYYTDGTESEVNTASAIFDIPAFNSPGIYTVSVLYRGSIAQTDVAVGITPNTVELYTLPDKTVYYVGQSFNSNGLSFKYLLSDGSVVLNENDYKISPVIFDTAGTVTVNVEFLNETFTFTVKVIPQESALKLSDESEWMLNSDTKKLTGLVERTTVAQLTAAFDVDVVVFDLKGNDVTSQTSLLVGTGFKVATMYNGEIADTADIIVKGDVNGNGRIDTNDYLLVKRAYINTIVIPEDSDIFTAADVNGNGIIDTNDYLKIKNHFRGTVNLFD